MLLFVPGYDDATNANLSVGKHLARVATMSLLEADATQTRLMDALAQTDKQGLPMFAMSHGRKNCLLGQNNTIALGIGEISMFRGRIGFAWACHTGTELGLAVSNEGGTWWGYTDWVSAPSELEPYHTVIRDVFQFVFDMIFSFRPSNDIEAVINAIK